MSTCCCLFTSGRLGCVFFLFVGELILSVVYLLLIVVAVATSTFMVAVSLIVGAGQFIATCGIELTFCSGVSLGIGRRSRMWAVWCLGGFFKRTITGEIILITS